MNTQTQMPGWQIAFFILALTYISMGIAYKLLGPLAAGFEQQSIFRTVIFGIGAALIAAFPAVRRSAAEALRRPLRKEYRIEVATVALANCLMPFAFAGSLAAWDLWLHGSAHLQAAIATVKPPDAELAWAFSRTGIFVLIASTVAAPVIEELVFRGFLFSAWERRWGWQWSTVLTSATFAAYHPHVVAAFIESVIFVCVLRRTGSLAGPIAVHAVYNLSLWYPLLGQFVFPQVPRQDMLSTWAQQFAALAIALFALPFYIWLTAKKPDGPPETTRAENQIPA